ncbi:MAG: polysaccharide deacetylase family protein [Armatimonadetes bacterium]|nr:polysaccharide deacetylase family protein [Armatimonadota bacterium]
MTSLRRRTLLCWSATGMLVLVAATGQASVVTDRLRDGCRYLVGARWTEAAQAFREAAAADAECAVAAAGEGTALLLAGFGEAAIASFTHALGLDAGLGAALCGRGSAHYLRGDLEAAWADYEQALTTDVPEPGSVRASAAHIACAVGKYTQAETLAHQALQEDPQDELARQALAAAALARGKPGEVLELLATPVRHDDGDGIGVVAESPLFAPSCQYYRDHGRDELERRLLARGGAGGLAPAALDSGLSHGDPQFRILWPRPGEQVSGRVEVGVEAAPEAQIQYIAVLVDGQFVGMTNAVPFRVWVDTTGCQEGLREIRVDGYGADGALTRWATVIVNVSNGQRTLAAEEDRTRQEVADLLSSLVCLRAEPLLRAQLVGHALEATGRLPEAVDAFEYAFSYGPSLAGTRADLALAYDKLGLTQRKVPCEVHTLVPGNHVALTFDDGPHPVLTPWILDLLDQYGAKATFFLVGRQAEMYPELTREIVRRGHEIGSHSYTHANQRELSLLAVERELVMSRLMLRRACGQFVTLFRPPGGKYDSQVQAAVRATGFTAVFWTENISGYAGETGPEILPKMLNNIGTNGIVLLHNGYDETREVLPLLLPALVERGLRMDTISALSEHRVFRPEPTVFYPPDWVL